MGAVIEGLTNATQQNFFNGKRKPSQIADRIYKKYDKDGNGMLDAKELGAFIKDAFPDSSLTPKEVQDVLNSMDLDDSGEVSYSELRAFLRCYDPEEKQLVRKTALIIIDVQNDFITGTLGGEGRADIVPVINSIRDKFDVVVISYDYHPHDHCSFVESANAGKVAMKEPRGQFTPFTEVTLTGDADRAEHKQMLYPRHAVQGTEGCKCHKDLVLRGSDKQIYKGTKANIDSYSAFFDNCKANDTGLTAMLEKEAVTDVFCCGLVFDICVKSSALHGAEQGFRTFIIEDGCRPLDPGMVPTVKTELSKAGVELVQSRQLLSGFDRNKLTLKDYLETIKKSKNAATIHARTSTRGWLPSETFARL